MRRKRCLGRYPRRLERGLLVTFRRPRSRVRRRWRLGNIGSKVCRLVGIRLRVVRRLYWSVKVEAQRAGGLCHTSSYIEALFRSFFSSSTVAAADDKAPRSSCNRTCSRVLATSKGCAIKTDVYFHSSSSTKSFTVWTADGDGSLR